MNIAMLFQLKCMWGYLIVHSLLESGNELSGEKCLCASVYILENHVNVKRMFVDSS